MKLKEAGIRNLVIGLLGILVLSMGLRYGLGTWLVYDKESLLKLMYTETAQMLRIRNIFPGCVLPAVAFVWMYLNYSKAIDGTSPHVTAGEKIHSLIPGIVLFVAEAVIVVVLYLVLPGALSQEELMFEYMIMNAFLSAAIAGAVADLILYAMAVVFLKPDILMKK